ncbi:hypothetical protein AB0395_45495 [Streptosporangium sp. NPDC051023]|uniref:hypothetical protein n=1 Tax=Streptosporangium sp. NPDC051023 TaxID=3155410 RepID=UPI003450236A
MISRKAAAVVAAGTLAAGGLLCGQVPALADGSPMTPQASCRSYTNDTRTIGYGACAIVDGWERWRLAVRCTTRSTDYYSPWQYTSLTKSYLCPYGGKVTMVWTDSQS